MNSCYVLIAEEFVTINCTSSVLKRKGYYQKIRHPEGYMDPRGYVDLAQDLLNWFDLKDVKI